MSSFDLDFLASPEGYKFFLRDDSVFLIDIENSIDFIHLHNCFQIPPAALWYRADNENFLGRVTKSSLRKLDNQRGLWAEERLFWGIPLNQLFKLLEGRSHILFLQEQGTKPIHTKH